METIGILGELPLARTGPGTKPGWKGESKRMVRRGDSRDLSIRVNRNFENYIARCDRLAIHHMEFNLTTVTGTVRYLLSTG